MMDHNFSQKQSDALHQHCGLFISLWSATVICLEIVREATLICRFEGIIWAFSSQSIERWRKRAYFPDIHRFHLHTFQFNVCWRCLLRIYYVKRMRIPWYTKTKKEHLCLRKLKHSNVSAWYRVSFQCKIAVFCVLVTQLWYKAECSKC